MFAGDAEVAQNKRNYGTYYHYCIVVFCDFKDNEHQKVAQEQCREKPQYFAHTYQVERVFYPLGECALVCEQIEYAQYYRQAKVGHEYSL